MSGNRYRRRPPWYHNNNQRGQPRSPRSNMSNFGYRRHELSVGSLASSYTQNGSVAAMPGEKYNNVGFQTESLGVYDSPDSHPADAEMSERYCPSTNASYNAYSHIDHEMPELMKAAFDTDFRFSANLPCSEGDWQDVDRNPYRTLPATASQQRQPPPILKKVSNPWTGESGGDGEGRFWEDVVPASFEHSGNVMSKSPLLPSRKPPPPHNVQPRVPSGRISVNPQNPAQGLSRQALPRVELDVEGSSGYFEALRQREQGRIQFGGSHGPHSFPAAQRGRPPQFVQLSAFAGHDNAPTFTNIGGSAGGPEHLGPQNRSIQGTWRGREGRGTAACRPPIIKREPPPSPDEAILGEGIANGPLHSRQKVGDARAILERKRRYSSDDDDEESPVSPRQQPSTFAHPSPARQMRQQAIRESMQQNTKLWVENHFSEADCASSHASDVHEVDESRLLPSDIQAEVVNYVVFVDIDKRSFFEEARQPFLPGTLLYLFYGDPSVLLPTKEHPFYKENRGSWVHFYPDCGTEYGTYLVAAPAVVRHHQLPFLYPGPV